MAIRHKRKATTGYTWLNTDLVDGQVGINTVDGTLHVLKTDNTVQTIQTGLLNIVEDLTPQLGGPLETLDNNIVITDGAGVIEGVIVNSTDGIAIAYTGADGIYESTDGGINLVPGVVELHGTVTKVVSLEGTESRQVYCSPDGQLYSVVPPDAGWEVIDTSQDTTDLGKGKNIGPWVEISDLTVNPVEDVDAGDRLNLYINLYVENTKNDAGTLHISIGINGVQPTAISKSLVIGGGTLTFVQAGFSVFNHGGLITTDDITVWIQRGDSAKDGQIILRGNLADHTFTVSVPGDGGSGGTAIWGGITGTLSDQNDLQTALNAKSDITHTHAVPDLSDTAIVSPAVDEVLTFNGTNWVNQALITGSKVDSASIVVSIPSNWTIPTSFTNIDWATNVHLQNNTNIIELSTSNTTRILIKETGLYFVSYSISFNADSGEEQINLRALVNDTTVIPGSERVASEDDEINGISNAITAEFTAGEYVTLQAMASGNGNILVTTSNFSLTRAGSITGADGPEGPEGPPGGATVSEVLFGHNGAITQTYATSTTINVGTIVRNDAYTVNTVVGGSEITVNTTGWYRVNYTVLINSTSNNRVVGYHQFELNATLVPGSKTASYHRNISNGQGSASTTVILQITAGQVLRIRSQSSGANIQTIANSCNILIESID